LTAALLRRAPVDVLVLVYNATDQVQHHFWHLAQPDACGFPPPVPDEVALFERAIEDVYAHCDAELARWLELFPQANVMLISDHGAGPTSGPQVRLNNALAQAGLLTWARSKTGVLSDAVAGFDRFLRRTLTAKQKALLARLLPGGRTRIEAMGLPAVDWSRTVAFAYEGFTLSPSIWINRRDRFPEGAVGPGAEYERACAAVTAALEGLKDPRTGAQVVPHVYRASEIYHGDWAAHAPDLILNWWDGQTFTIAQSHPRFDGQPVVFYPSEPARAGQDITGIHRRDGILVAAGPQLAALAEGQADPANLIDVAPTALALLGLEVPADMDGRVLADMLRARRPAPARTASSEMPPPAEPVADVHAYTAREEQRIARRLADLGYL
jgi:predicted AlkP superfamily phosphohydrolase/phosphomutase